MSCTVVLHAHPAQSSCAVGPAVLLRYRSRESHGGSPICKPGSVSMLAHTGRSFLSACSHLHAPAAYPRLDALRHPFETGRLSPPIWPCSDRGLPSHIRCRMRGGLLPHPFTLTATCATAVCFLLHCPSHTAHAACAQGLPGSLPYGARTFLGIPVCTGISRPSDRRPP